MLAASFHIISWVRSKTIGVALGQALAQPSHTRSNNAQPRSQQQSEKRNLNQARVSVPYASDTDSLAALRARLHPNAGNWREACVWLPSVGLRLAPVGPNRLLASAKPACRSANSPRPPYRGMALLAGEISARRFLALYLALQYSICMRVV